MRVSSLSAVSVPLREVPSERLFAAVDVGGTKIAGGLVDGAGELVCRVVCPTPVDGSAQAVWEAVSEVVGQLSADPRWARVVAVGVGSAGPVDTARGTVSPVNIPGWRDFELVRSLESLAEVGARPVVLGGDAVAMAAAEHWRGAARGQRNVLCVVVSTGVGAGLVLGGVLHAGRSGNAGHLGHICVDLDGEQCACGSRGCLEGLASGTAIARHARRAGWRPADGGAAADATAVAVAARGGDRLALAAFDRAAQALAAGIAATATLVELDLAVIGGGVAQAGEVLFGPLRRHLAEYAALSFVAGLPVVPAALGTDAGLIGAAALAATHTTAEAARIPT